jgi:hypothetical protein
MPGKGRTPSKTEWSRERDQRRREAEFVKVSDDGQLRGPVLPESTTWHERTLAWWDNWRRSPLSQTFTTTDWDFLLDTALLHNDLWAGNTGVAAELRLRVAKFGASPEDRLRLKVEVTDEVAAAKAEPRVDSDRKARLVAVANA